MRALALLVAIFICGAVALPPNAEQSGLRGCGNGARFASNRAGLYFCVYGNLPPPPPGVSLAPYCGYLADGYIGYSWELAQAPNYTCPTSARQTTNGGSLGFCLWGNLPLNPGIYGSLKPYCHYLADLYMGYSFEVNCDALITRTLANGEAKIDSLSNAATDPNHLKA